MTIKATQEPITDFKPIELTIVLQSKEEFYSLLELHGCLSEYDIKTFMQKNRGKSNNSNVNCSLRLSEDIYKALKQLVPNNK